MVAGRNAGNRVPASEGEHSGVGGEQTRPKICFGRDRLLLQMLAENRGNYIQIVPTSLAGG